MKQRIAWWDYSAAPGFYIYDYDFPHPIGPFGSIAIAHDWLVKRASERLLELLQ